MLVRAQWYLRGAPPFRAVDPAGTLDAEIARTAIIYGAPPERIRRSHRGAILFFRHARVFIVAPVPPMAAFSLIYLRYCLEHGETDPNVMLAKDSERHPGGRMTGFLLWVSAKRRAFHALNPKAFFQGSAAGGIIDIGAWERFLGAPAAPCSPASRSPRPASPAAGRRAGLKASQGP